MYNGRKKVILNCQIFKLSIVDLKKSDFESVYKIILGLGSATDGCLLFTAIYCLLGVLSSCAAITAVTSATAVTAAIVVL
jgi:hypothetical protein